MSFALDWKAQSVKTLFIFILKLWSNLTLARIESSSRSSREKGPITHGIQSCFYSPQTMNKILRGGNQHKCSKLYTVKDYRLTLFLIKKPLWLVEISLCGVSPGSRSWESGVEVGKSGAADLRAPPRTGPTCPKWKSRSVIEPQSRWKLALFGVADCQNRAGTTRIMGF